jgi:hypothetical protein
MMGPVILEYLVDYYTRFNSSTDAILTFLQVGAVYFVDIVLSSTHECTFFLLASSLETFDIRTADYPCSYHTLESSAFST